MRKAVSAILTGVVLAGAVMLGVQETDVQRTYLDAAELGNGFVAIGTGGLVDRIGTDGVVQGISISATQDLVDVCSAGDLALAVGDEGRIVRIPQTGDAEVMALNKSIKLLSVANLNGLWLAGAENGVVYSSRDGEHWTSESTGAEGDLVGLAATEDRCIGVTETGEVAYTTDGSQWTLLDYNAYYGKKVCFGGIEAIDDAFWAYGTDQDGKAVVVISVMGGVWSERDLNIYEVDQTIDGSENPFTALISDGTQVFAVTEAGNALVLPGCTQCNTQRQVSSGPVSAAASNGSYLLFAGPEYSVSIQNTADVRQEHIKADAAQTMQQNGAVIIDVRSEEEYQQGHIPGSIHIDVSEIERKLPECYPQRDQELIFYCSAGKRSQTAVETAKTLGYQNVYNLGKLSDWPYELELS